MNQAGRDSCCRRLPVAPGVAACHSRALMADAGILINASQFKTHRKPLRCLCSPHPRIYEIISSSRSHRGTRGRGTMGQVTCVCCKHPWRCTGPSRLQLPQVRGDLSIPWQGGWGQENATMLPTRQCLSVTARRSSEQDASHPWTQHQSPNTWRGCIAGEENSTFATHSLIVNSPFQVWFQHQPLPSISTAFPPSLTGIRQAGSKEPLRLPKFWLPGAQPGFAHCCEEPFPKQSTEKSPPNPSGSCSHATWPHPPTPAEAEPKRRRPLTPRRKPPALPPPR